MDYLFKELFNGGEWFITIDEMKYHFKQFSCFTVKDVRQEDDFLSIAGTDGLEISIPASAKIESDPLGFMITIGETEITLGRIENLT